MIGCHVDDLLCTGEHPEFQQAIAAIEKEIRFGARKAPPLDYCGARVLKVILPDTSFDIQVNQRKYIMELREASAPDKDYTAAVRQVTGSVLWSAGNTSPLLCFDCSWLGSRVMQVVEALSRHRGDYYFGGSANKVLSSQMALSYIAVVNVHALD